MMLAYHELSPKPTKDVYAITGEVFRRQMHVVREACGLRPCVTFDDGHRSQWEIAAPVLEETGIAAIFFITTAWIGSEPTAMRWSDLQRLIAHGHGVGSHTHTHPLLTTCSDAQLRGELKTSKQLLEQKLGTEVDSISVPGGRVDARVLAACAEAGYRRVYTSRAHDHHVAAPDSPERTGRLIVRHSTSDRLLAGFLHGDASAHRRIELEFRVKKLVKELAGDSLYQRVWRWAFRVETHGAS